MEPPILARTPGSALDVLLTVLTGMVGSPEGNEVLSVGFVRQVLALCYSLMWGGHQARCAPIRGVCHGHEMGHVIVYGGKWLYHVVPHLTHLSVFHDGFTSHKLSLVLR